MEKTAPEIAPTAAPLMKPLSVSCPIKAPVKAPSKVPTRAKTKVKRAEKRLARSEEMAEWKQSLIRWRSERGYVSISLFLSDFFWKTKRNNTGKEKKRQPKQMERNEEGDEFWFGFCLKKIKTKNNF